MAMAGCVLVVLAGPRYIHSYPMFIGGSAFTGVGTAVLCVNAGLTLCSLKPDAALRTILICELIASLVNYMVVGLP